jgi:hypothetical protein
MIAGVIALIRLIVEAFKAFLLWAQQKQEQR